MIVNGAMFLGPQLRVRQVGIVELAPEAVAVDVAVQGADECSKFGCARCRSQRELTTQGCAHAPNRGASR